MHTLAQKNIIVLCDGTANQATVYTETNVVRIAEMLDKTDNYGSRQVVFYDPGLGTEGGSEARKEAIKQEWNIETALAFNYLEWMTEAAKAHGLRFKEEVKKGLKIENPKLHNPLKPFWWILGWKKRTLPEDNEKTWTK